MANNEIRDYSFDENNSAKLNGTPVGKAGTSSSSRFIGKVFLNMFAGLLITSIVAIGLAFLFAGLINNATEVEEVESIYTALITTYIISAIGVLILSFVIPMVFAKGKHNILIPAVLYSVMMGVLLTVVVLFTDPYILIYSLGITTGIFGLMALIGFIGNGRMKGVTITIIGLFSGIMLLSIANLVFMFVAPELFTSIYWLISLGFFAIILLVTVWDMRNIKMIAQRAIDTGNNVSLYCAFIIYTDFISILIRVIYYLGIASNRK